MNNIWVATDWHIYTRDNDPRHPFRSRHNLGKLADTFAQDIQEDDLLIFLGDLCDPDVSDPNKVSVIVNSIPCHKIMCRGNHDIQDDTYYLEAGFDEICDVVKIHNIIFSHKPLRIAPDEINIHGHLHTEKMSGLTYQHINAYVANWNDNDHPVLLEDLLASATVQDIDIPSAMQKHCEEKFHKYTSIENDHYMNILDISDQFPMYPVDETSGLVNEAAFIYTGKISDADAKYYGEAANDYVSQIMSTLKNIFKDMISRVEKNSGYKFAAAFKMASTKYPKWTYHNMATTNPNFGTDKNTGRANTDIPLVEIKMPTFYYDIATYDRKLLKNMDDGIAQKGISSIVIGGSRAIQLKFKTDTDLNVVVGGSAGSTIEKGTVQLCITLAVAKKMAKMMDESAVTDPKDILDEILFDDVYDTKYWLADDDKYRDKRDKGEEAGKSVVGIDETGKAPVYYRFTYQGSTVGIYEEFKSHCTYDEWKEFKNSTACSWLPQPKLSKAYGANQSFFTKAGHDKFMKLVYPIFAEKLDSTKIVCDTVTELPGGIVYRDKYQVVINTSMSDSANESGMVLNWTDMLINEEGKPCFPSWWIHEYRPLQEVSRIAVDPLIMISPSDEMNEFQITPRVPSNYMTKNGFEDNTTPRICFCTSIKNALKALSANLAGQTFYVYTPSQSGVAKPKYKVITPTKQQVPDVDITGERWICEPIWVDKIAKIKVTHASKNPGQTYTYGKNNEYKATLYDWDFEYEWSNMEDSCGGVEYRLNEMAYEDAQDVMYRILNKYCKEFNKKDKYFDDIRRKWKKEDPNAGEPPRLKWENKAANDNQLFYILADVNTDNATPGQIAAYRYLMHDFEKAIQRDPEIKKFRYITKIRSEAEDVVGLYVELMGIGAFGANDPEVYWPKIVAHPKESENPNDWKSKKAVDIKFENDKYVEVGEASVSGIDSDEPYLYNVEVYPRYRGKKYGDAIMRYLMKTYKPTELCVETDNVVAQKMYEKFGFKKDGYFEDYHATMLVMRTKPKHKGKFVEEPIGEAVADTHSIDRNDKRTTAEKYGLRSVGDTHEASKEEEEEMKKRAKEKEEKRKRDELEKKRKKRLKALEKGRRTQKRNRFIKKIKSHLPGVKNEEADALNGVFDIDFPEDTTLTEAASYRFEMVDHVQFFDRVNEAAQQDKKLHPVYVVLIQGNSPVSALIRGFTKATYTHVSISFDPSLTKMYSFAGKDKVNPLEMIIGGFKTENINWDYYKKNKIPYAVYVVPSTQDEINRMKKRLDYFIQNETKFTFDYLGLIRNFFKVPNEPKYTWFCSRFVADILNAGNPDKKLVDEPSLFRPEDVKSAKFAQFIDSGMASEFNPKKLELKVKAAMNTAEMRAHRVNESYDIIRDNPWQKQVLQYQLAKLDEAALEDFLMYLQSFKIRFDKDGNILITRREYDQLDMHFRQSLKMIKAYEDAGNVEGVKDELCKIHYMIELINQYYLKPNVKNLRENAKDVRKDMLDLRSVMMNVFKQHLRYVTARDPRWNFERYYQNSTYGKNFKIPQKVITQIGTAVMTALK